MARLSKRARSLDPAERRAVDALPRYAGEAFRADSGFWPESDTSAADVLRFERDELGNADVVIDPVIERVLDRVGAESVVWVCRTARDARRFGDDIVPVVLTADTRILVADDGDGGLLLWLRLDQFGN